MGCARPPNRITPRLNTVWASSMLPGRGVAEDVVEAVKWYRKAAEQNYAAAQYQLGVCYYRRGGVAKDLAEAAKWYRKAAEQNHPRGSIPFRRLLCQRPRRGARNAQEAVKWLRKAAERNHATAQYMFGPLLPRG